MLPQFLKTFWNLVLHNQSNSGIEEHVTTDSQATWERRCSRFLLMDFTDVCGKRKENKPQTLGKLPQVHIFYHWEPLPFYFITLALNPSLLICFRQPYLQRYKNVWSSSSLKMIPLGIPPSCTFDPNSDFKTKGPKPFIHTSNPLLGKTDSIVFHLVLFLFLLDCLFLQLLVTETLFHWDKGLL